MSFPLEASIAALKRLFEIESASDGERSGLFIVNDIFATKAAPLFQVGLISIMLFKSFPTLGSFIIHFGFPPLELIAPP